MQYLGASNHKKVLIPLGLEGARKKQSLAPERATIGAVAVREGVQPIQGTLAWREWKNKYPHLALLHPLISVGASLWSNQTGSQRVRRLISQSPREGLPGNSAGWKMVEGIWQVTSTLGFNVFRN